MRISEAARRLGTSARMLRYREDLGLLPQVRDRRGLAARESAARESAALGSGQQSRGSGSPAARGSAHRQFSEADLEAVAAALMIERRYDISPASLAFGLRVIAEPPVRAAVADLGRRLGRIPAPASRALDFEKERALRALSGMQNRPRMQALWPARAARERHPEPAREHGPSGVRASGRCRCSAKPQRVSG